MPVRKFIPKWKGETLATFFGGIFGTRASNKCLEATDANFAETAPLKTWWFKHIFRGRVLDLPCHGFRVSSTSFGFRVESIRMFTFHANVIWILIGWIEMAWNDAVLVSLHPKPVSNLFGRTQSS